MTNGVPCRPTLNRKPPCPDPTIFQIPVLCMYSPAQQAIVPPCSLSLDEQCYRAISLTLNGPAIRQSAFAVAFTGLAEILGAPTADWFLDHLASLNASALPFSSILQSLRDQAATTWPHLPANARRIGITVIFSGFGPAEPFCALLSNMEDSHGNPLPTLSADFQTTILRKKKKRLRKLDTLIHGRDDAITGTIDLAIPSVRRCFLHKPVDKRVDVFVELLRRAADHPEGEKYICKDCMSVIVPASGEFIARYHPTGSHPIQYAPNLLSNGMAFKGIEFASPPGWTIKLGGS